MKIFVIAIAVSLVFTACVFAEGAENKDILTALNLEASGSFDVYSKYVWRGFTLDTDPVFQPGFNLSGYGCSFSFWSSWDLDNNDTLNSDEIDYVVDYTKEFGDLSVSAGHTYYEFPGTDTFSREFYAGIGFDGFFVSPRVTYYYDYGDHARGGGDGQYAVLDVSRGIPLIKDSDVSLDIIGHIGYNRKLFINGEGGDCLIGAALNVPLTEGLSLSPSVNYTVPFGDLSDSNDGNQRERFYYGFSLSSVF
jgi:hypothetical protein